MNLMIKSLAASCLRIIGGVFIFYCLAVAGIYLYQDTFVFVPQALDRTNLKDANAAHQITEDVDLLTPDGIHLKGWFVKKGGAAKTPLIVYFGGNMEEVSSMLHKAPWFEGWSVVFLNYRGYGLSGGKPSEKHLFSDALFIYDTFAKRPEVDSGRIVIMGRSLGTGVAVYVARQRTARGVILVSPYDSITSVAKDKLPFIPVDLILKHKFDSLSRVPDIKTSLLAVIADQDTTIEPRHSVKLLEKWGGRYSTVVIKGADHDSLMYSGLYWRSINDFLAAIPAGKTA
jgi:alpha-beta hydrolase superfamily lysophospholipase